MREPQVLVLVPDNNRGDTEVWVGRDSVQTGTVRIVPFAVDEFGVSIPDYTDVLRPHELPAAHRSRTGHPNRYFYRGKIIAAESDVAS
jgi:hypothetical protein